MAKATYHSVSVRRRESERRIRRWIGWSQKNDRHIAVEKDHDAKAVKEPGNVIFFDLQRESIGRFACVQ